jgi:hypothetical protein
VTATRSGVTSDSPIFIGDPQAPTPSADDADTSIATTGFVASEIAEQNLRGFTLGKGGSILTTDTNAADYPFCVPYDCTLLRMKATLKTAASGAMVVQLRTAAGPVTTAPTYSDVTGFTCTFANTRVLATIDPTDVDVSEGDFLNFSCATGSGANLLVEIVAALR